MATLKEHLAAGTLPNHLALDYWQRHFDLDAEVPERMVQSANWMNEGDVIEGEPIYVRTGTGVHPITNLIHVQRLLYEDGGVIVPAPAVVAEIREAQ